VTKSSLYCGFRNPFPTWKLNIEPLTERQS